MASRNRLSYLQLLEEDGDRDAVRSTLRIEDDGFAGRGSHGGCEEEMRDVWDVRDALK